MNPLHAYEGSCSKSEVELFNTPPVNISMSRGDFVSHQPVATLTDDGPIEFHVPSSAEDYIDLGRTLLYLKLKVLQNDGTALGANAHVAPANLMLHTLFSQVDVKFRDTLVTPSVNTYPYKSYLETLLVYGEGAKHSHKTSEGWYADKGAGVEDTDPANTTNSGFTSRHNFIARSRVVELLGRPHCDVLQQDRYLIPGVDVSLKFNRSTSAFHLISGVNCKTQIINATLFIRKVKLSSSLELHHASLLGQGKRAKYPLRRGIVTTFTEGTGSLSFNKENVVSGQLPRRVIVGFVENSAFNGTRDKNPFNFQHFNLTYLTLTTGKQNFPSQPLKLNYGEGEYLQGYGSLMMGLGLTNADRGIEVHRDNYVHGNVLYAFDLTADMAEGAHVDPISTGNLRMDAAFSTGLAAPVNVIVYAEYDNVLQIDRARNILTDFQSS